MGLIQIDKGKCKRDGICAAVCPAEVIRFDGEKFPVEGAGAERGCIACGHCVAACPTEALSNSRVTGCLPFEKNLKTDVKALEQFLKMRRSVREFKPTPVPRETLEQVIDTARWAPSAGNSQPVRWLVVEDPEVMEKLSGLVAGAFRTSREIYFKRLVDAWDQGRDIILFNAPHLIVAHAPPLNLFSPVNCVIALTYLELAAKANGLGTCWAGFFVSASAYEKGIAECLGLPQEHTIFGAVMIGYPKFHYYRIPEKNPAMIDWL